MNKTNKEYKVLKLKELDNKKELVKAEKEDRLFYVICPSCECVELYYNLKNVHSCLQCDSKFLIKNYLVVLEDLAKEEFGLTRSNWR
tara:strand:- start:130 stop:390 length:261 start_codon:yes stop_codon:yes gene_type:complete